MLNYEGSKDLLCKERLGSVVAAENQKAVRPDLLIWTIPSSASLPIRSMSMKSQLRCATKDSITGRYSVMPVKFDWYGICPTELYPLAFVTHYADKRRNEPGTTTSGERP